MKTIMILFMGLTIGIFAQDKSVKSINEITPEMKECIVKVKSSNAAVKILLKEIMMDKEHRNEIYKEMMNDNEMKKLMKEAMEDHKKMMDNHHKHDTDGKMHHNKEN